MPNYEAAQLEVDVKFFAHEDGDKANAKVSYEATVVFSSISEAVKCGAKFVVWTLQRKAREGSFPSGRKVRVDANGNFTKTIEEQLDALTDAEVERMEQLLAARKKAMAAQKQGASKPAAKK